MSKWTLFSNHGHVLLFLSQDHEARLRDVAGRVGITERAVQKIVRDLQDGGMLSVTKHGRRNRYRIHARKALRHPLEAHCCVGQLVTLVSPSTGTDKEAEAPAEAPFTPSQPDSGPEKKPDEGAGPEPGKAPPQEPARDPGEQGSLF